MSETVKQKPSPNIELCADGVYRWIYEYKMMKNPVILFTIIKVIIIAALVIGILTFVMSLGDSGDLSEKIKGAGLTALIPCAVLLVLAVPSYIIVAAQNGWKYIVAFEMDEQGITHMQEPRQFSKSQGLMWLSAMAGAAAGSLSSAGAGLLAASHNITHSDFLSVKSVKVLRRWNTIKLNQTFAKNQVYAEKEDFDFVLQYIKSRCVNAKIQ